MAPPTAKNLNDMTLHEVRSLITRRKMGIESNHRWKEVERDFEADIKAVDFILKHFHTRECMSFVRDSNANMETCFCGELEALHPGQHAKKWNEDEIEIFEDCQNVAFGSIVFRDDQLSPTRNPSKFIRVGANIQMKSLWRERSSQTIDDDDPVWGTVDDVIRLMRDHWKLFNPVPQLAVAVIGGAKQFALDKKWVNHQIVKK